MTVRCAWVPENDQLYIQYHDLEWGVPVHNDQLWFEFLVLEGFQAGLSWKTVLYKRENFRNAFSKFNPELVADLDESKISELLQDAGIIRNKSKILACISNAQAFMKVQEEFGSFDKYMWAFVGGKPIAKKWQSVSDLPAHSVESDAMSKDLIQRGFKFVGSTICYAHMQATGLVNDHTIDCFRYNEISRMSV